MNYAIGVLFIIAALANHFLYVLGISGFESTTITLLTLLTMTVVGANT